MYVLKSLLTGLSSSVTTSTYFNFSLPCLNNSKCTINVQTQPMSNLDHIIQIWSNCNLCHFILCGMVDHTNLIWNVSTQSKIFLHHKALAW